MKKHSSIFVFLLCLLWAFYVAPLTVFAIKKATPIPTPMQRQDV